MEKMDRHEFNGAESAIDSSDEFVDYGPEILVLFNILAAGDCDLDENDFADPFGMLSEEDFEGVELLGYAFDVIKSVYSDDEFHAFKFAFQHLDSLLDAWFL
jgi:hypothetical protein